MSIENESNSKVESTVGFEVAFPIICATVSILALVVLKKYLKNLNEVIKNILIALSLHNLVSSMIAGGIILFWNGNNTILERCNTLHVLTASNAIITVQTLALISFTKYYLAWKTSKLETTNLLIIIGLTVCDCVTGYAMALAPTLVSLTPFASACVGNEDQNRILKMVPRVYSTFSATVMGIGFVYDASLYFFLKKRHQQERGAGQAQLVPWKSSNQEDYKYSIPIGASAIALTTGIIVLGFGTLINVSKRTLTYYVAFGLGYILPSVLLVAMLGLTIRTAWNQKPKPTIPKGPCFHDDVEEGQNNAGFENALENDGRQDHHGDEAVNDPEEDNDVQIREGNGILMNGITQKEPYMAEQKKSMENPNAMEMDEDEMPPTKPGLGVEHAPVIADDVYLYEEEINEYNY